MSSNLREKPVEGGGEQDEAEEGFGEFIVAGADAPETFEACVGIFDGVAMSIERGIEVVDFSAAGFERDAGKYPMGGQRLAKFVGVEGAVGHQPAAALFAPQPGARFQIVAVARCQLHRNRPAQSVDDHGQLGVEPSLGAAHRLRLLASRRIGSMRMHLDAGCIHGPDLAKATAGDLLEQVRPQARPAPAPPACIDRLPWTELCGQIAPG